MIDDLDLQLEEIKQEPDNRKKLELLAIRSRILEQELNNKIQRFLERRNKKNS